MVARQSGLLVQHLCRDPEKAAYSALISSMLAAMRDFAHDAFGRGVTASSTKSDSGSRGEILTLVKHGRSATVNRAHLSHDKAGVQLYSKCYRACILLCRGGPGRSADVKGGESDRFKE